MLEGLKGESNISQICHKYGISQSLYYKWRDKFLDGGKEALKNSRGFFVGLSNVDDIYHTSASVGLEVISGRKTTGGGLNLFSKSNKKNEKIGPIFGLALSSQLFWKIGKVVGLGLELFADLNKSESLSGATITLFVGKLY